MSVSIFVGILQEITFCYFSEKKYERNQYLYPYNHEGSLGLNLEEVPPTDSRDLKACKLP